jgi:hypothetical protein
VKSTIIWGIVLHIVLFPAKRFFCEFAAGEGIFRLPPIAYLTGLQVHTQDTSFWGVNHQQQGLDWLDRPNSRFQIRIGPSFFCMVCIFFSCLSVYTGKFF